MKYCPERPGGIPACGPGSTEAPLNSNYDYLDLAIVSYGEELITAYIQQPKFVNSGSLPI